MEIFFQLFSAACLMAIGVLLIIAGVMSAKAAKTGAGQHPWQVGGTVPLDNGERLERAILAVLASWAGVAVGWLGVYVAINGWC